MSNYKQFRVEAQSDGKSFKVQVKGWLFWKSGFVWTDYFNINYDTERLALLAITKYVDRYTNYIHKEEELGK